MTSWGDFYGLWGAQSGKKKILSIQSWKVVCSDREQGDLGIINLDTMNTALPSYGIGLMILTSRWNDILVILQVW